jgi:ATP-binding cassette subfamily C protein CydD/ATP-binding cassette subfamily C protein CydCD
LKVPAGSRLLLTGPSGCGKSTLLKAAAGLMLPREGSLCLSDIDLHKLAPVSRQKIISYLPQEPHIFAATLADNLSLFQEVPTERMRQALRLASLEKWFDKLPAGLDTPLGAGGLSLSHGERKRLGLARIILQNRPLVLLDEPTNGLDQDAERAVLKALTAFSWQRTVIVVSHRPALREWAERIIDWEELFPQEQRP